MEKELQQLLFKSGVLRTYVGYNYLVKAIFLVYDTPDRLLNTCKEIYLPIALEFGTDPRSVEKDLRTVRDVFMRNNGKAVLSEMGYSISQDQPYPREIIEIFAEYFRLKHMN